MLGERHQGTLLAFLPHRCGVVGGMTVDVEHHGFVELLAGEIGDAGLAHRHDRRGEVQDERTVRVGAGHRHAHGICAEAGLGAVERRDERKEVVDVHEVDRDHACGGSLLAVGADAAEMAAATDRVHADAVLLRALDGHVGRLAADALAVASATVELEHGARVLDDVERGVGNELAFVEVLGVHGDHAHAVAVVAAKVRADHVFGDDAGFVLAAAGGLEEVTGKALKFCCWVAHGCCPLYESRFEIRRIPIPTF